MKELIAMQQEYHNIVEDLKQHPNHIYMYDLEALNKEICLKYIKCAFIGVEQSLLGNTSYMKFLFSENKS